MENKYTEEQEREIQYLKSNYEMLERTKEEARLRGGDKAVKRIELAQQDTIKQMENIDPILVKEMQSNNNHNDMFQNSILDVLPHKDIESNPLCEPLDIEKISKEIQIKDEYEFNNIDDEVQYDIIELPSKGQCYKDKFSRIPVGYLTAYDENLITSPNLYKDGLIIDYLLKHKVLNKNINLSELCKGDVDAITLFLRVTSYGPEYPIIARDPETGENVETVIDLSQFKTKDFNLQGDENGWFEYELPISKDKIKFRFLTRNDDKVLKRLADIEDYGIRSSKVRQLANDLVNIIRKDDILDGKEKQSYIDSLKKMNDWCFKLDAKEKTPYSKIITNRLELSIMAVNGETDRNMISRYVKKMSARDALMLRRYILENEPGINFEIEVPRPESLGGGSFKTFLEWDDSVFLNIV